MSTEAPRQIEFTAERAGRTLDCAVAGSAEEPLVVLVPGLGQGRKLFGTLWRRIAREGFRCAVYDPIGIPPSSPHPDGEDWRFEDAADDLIAVAEAAHRASGADPDAPILLVGTSLGGKVAMTATARHAERVVKLVALASSFVPSARGRLVFRFFAHVAEDVSDDAFGQVVAPFLIGRSFTEARPRMVDDLARATRPTPESRALMKAQARAIGSFDASPVLAGIQCPTLLLAGTEDTLTDVADVEATAHAIDSAEFARIENAGHSLLLESVPALERVLAFLGS